MTFNSNESFQEWCPFYRPHCQQFFNWNYFLPKKDYSHWGASPCIRAQANILEKGISKPWEIKLKCEKICFLGILGKSTLEVKQGFWGGHDILEEFQTHTWHSVQWSGCCVKCTATSHGRTKVHQLQISLTVWYSNFMLDQNIVKHFLDTFIWRMDTGGKRSSRRIKLYLSRQSCDSDSVKEYSEPQPRLRIAFPNLKHLLTHMLLTTQNTPRT